MVAFTLGELVGFGVLPVVLGTLAWAWTGGLQTGLRAVVLYLVAVVAGFGEGAVLAAFQLRVLRPLFPALSSRGWLLHTGFAASFAWAVGMLAPTLDDIVGLPGWVRIAIWLPGSALILLSIGGVQARLLSPHVPAPWRWLWANVLGWLLGLPWTFLLPQALPDDSPVWLFGVAMAVGGVLMGATAGAVTGYALVRFATSGE